MATARASVLVSALVVAGVAASGAIGEDGSSPRLTQHVPEIVLTTCGSARAKSPIRILCPPLVPATKYRTFPGLWGVVLGNSAPVEPPKDRFYLVGFNGGDSGPRYWHWMAGMGTPEAIEYWVLSDVRNLVRGKPKRVRVVVVDSRSVDIWRFPEYRAGGQFGGHYAAITPAARLRAIANIHGDNADGAARMAVALARRAGSTATSGTSTRRFERHGITFRYPRSWFVTTESLSNGIDPKYLFTVSTDPVRRTPDDLGPCLPGIARQLPDDAVLAYVREAFSGRGTSLPRMQTRPASFRLPTRTDNSLCGFPHGRWVPFKSGGRAFYLGLYVGNHASKADVRALAHIVDGMQIEPRST